MRAFVSCNGTDTNNFLGLVTALVLLGHVKINTRDKTKAAFKSNVHTKLVVYDEKKHLLDLISIIANHGGSQNTDCTVRGNL